MAYLNRNRIQKVKHRNEMTKCVAGSNAPVPVQAHGEVKIGMERRDLKTDHWSKNRTAAKTSKSLKEGWLEDLAFKSIKDDTLIHLRKKSTWKMRPRNTTAKSRNLVE
jgi:hypothetical protein